MSSWEINILVPRRLALAKKKSRHIFLKKRVFYVVWLCYGKIQCFDKDEELYAYIKKVWDRAFDESYWIFLYSNSKRFLCYIREDWYCTILLVVV